MEKKKGGISSAIEKKHRGCCNKDVRTISYG